jgi:beta-lactamase class D
MAVQMPRGRRKTYISNRNFIILLVLFALIAGMELRSRFSDGGDLARFFAPYQGCLALRDISTGKTIHHNEELASRRLPPQSTFKIANALIALDSGVAGGPDMSLAWDGQTRPVEAWNRDHTLASAMQNSAVWYFQELSRRVGPERMQPYLKTLDYGNANISGGVDRFWLGGGLAISADEQVDFLARLFSGDLPVKPQVQDQVKEMLFLAQGDRGVLRGKTGTRGGQGQPDLGWFVGWVERGGKAQVFALNLQGEGASGQKARQVAEAVLRELRLW